MTNESIQKAAQEYADDKFIETVVNEKPWPEAKEAYAKAFADGAEHALSHQWVSVDEALPEEGQRIVICYQSFYKGRYLTLYMTDRYGSEGFNGGTLEPSRVIAWMPLPAIQKLISPECSTHSQS